jgi:hypothetical protein
LLKPAGLACKSGRLLWSRKADKNILEAHMSEVLIRCPQTGKDVPTGLMLDDQAFLNADLPDQEAHCPHCGRQHHWQKNDAYLRRPPLERPTH